MASPSIPIDYVRVALAGVGVHILGALVYSVSGFGKRWYEGHRPRNGASTPDTPSKNTRSTKAKTQEKHGHPAFVMATSFLMGLLTAFVAAHILVFAEAYFKETGVLFALRCALWNFIGFDLTYTIFNAVWLDTASFSISLDLFYHLAKQVVIYVILSAPSPF